MTRWAGVIIVIGVALALRGYLANWSLWLDELLIAEQIIDRSFAGLTEQLTNGQNAPIGWLWAVKAATLGLGESEYALRLVPLLAGAAAAPIGWLAMRRIAGPRAGLISLAVFVLAWPTSAYAATVKQYSTDVLVATLILWAAARAAGLRPGSFEAEARRAGPYVTLLWVGLIVQWFSHPAVFMLGGVGLTLLISKAARRRWRRVAGLTAVGVAWLAAFAVHYELFLKLDPTWQWQWLHAHWERLGGYMPWSSGPVAAALWLPRALADVMGRATGLGELGWAALAVALIGGVRLWRTNRVALGFCAMPLALAALAGALHRYPLADRLTLFLAPGMALLLGAAATWGLAALRKRGRPGLARATAAVVVGPVALSAAAWAAWPWMPAIEHTRPLVRRLAAAHNRGEPIVVNHWAQHAWRYYAPRFGLDHVEPIIAPREDEAPTKPRFGATLKPLDGEPRVWLLLTHYADHPWDRPTEFTRLADRLGQRADRRKAMGASLLRYDFSDEPAPAPTPRPRPRPRP